MICGEEIKRRKFVKTIVEFCLDARLDGVDIDWEHPENAIEEEAYGKLLSATAVHSRNVAALTDFIDWGSDAVHEISSIRRRAPAWFFRSDLSRLIPHNDLHARPR